MSITDKLREYAKGWGWLDADNADEIEVLLEDFANRIDKEHKAAVDKAHADGERNGLQQARSASEDYRRGFGDGVTSGMKEHGWVKLPVDKDGNVVTLGSYVRIYPFDGPRKKVKALRWSGFGWKVIMVDDSSQPVCRVKVCKGQTPEDVLREFVYAILNQKPEFREKNIAEYAAKLQLREDA